MRLYDFSEYAKQRAERRSAEQVQEFVSHLNEPGAVIEFKKRVEGWLILHCEVLKQANG